ncbi:MAG: AAA family ATPase [Vicinamibacteria bacterium]
MTIDPSLLHIINHRLEPHASEGEWPYLVIAALDGDSAFDGALQPAARIGLPKADAPAAPAAQPRKVFLQEIRVRGFRGIGLESTLSIAPGPGLTLVVGRNGCGKSSFAEAAELLITHKNMRWEKRTEQWKEGFRNLHQPKAALHALFTVEGGRSYEVHLEWKDDADLGAWTEYVQPLGEPRTTYDALGWAASVESYRPVLSYNELGGMLEEQPSKFFDALSRILGLDALTDAAGRLQKARTERERLVKDSQKSQKELAAHLSSQPDPRAQAIAASLARKAVDLGEVEKVLAGGSDPEGSASELKTLKGLMALGEISDDAVTKSIEALDLATSILRAKAGTLAARSAELANLLDAALRFHTGHGDGDCPVCGDPGALHATWHAEHQAMAVTLRAEAKGVHDAQSLRKAALDGVRSMAQIPEGLLKSALALSLPAQDVLGARARVMAALELDADACAAEVKESLPRLRDALGELRTLAAVELTQREDLWRPLAQAVNEWLPVARHAMDAVGRLSDITKAEKWLKDANEDLRNERFAPLASEVKRIWEQLRHNSNVSLEDIRLTGVNTSRKVQLDVKVDGTEAKAIGVMSQGELHALALALFLPRAMLGESPFGFVLIDDPVQSMDPARVDGLARVLRDAAKTRQVIVFTHDDRLPESMRRQGVAATFLEVTRRDQSVVEVTTQIDPVGRYLEDARAVALTSDLPAAARGRVIPGLCRGAVEAASMLVLRRRWLVAGKSRDEVEERLLRAEKLNQKLALVLFNDDTQTSEVMSRLNGVKREFADTVRTLNEGSHAGVEDPTGLVNATQRLAEWVRSQK